MGVPCVRARGPQSTLAHIKKVDPAAFRIIEGLYNLVATRGEIDFENELSRRRSTVHLSWDAS